MGEQVCAVCFHRASRHASDGCHFGDCLCVVTPGEIASEVPPPPGPRPSDGATVVIPPEPEPVVYELPPALAPEVREIVDAALSDVRARTAPGGRPVRLPRRERARPALAHRSAPPAGEVLISYPAWLCSRCGSRRFEEFDCCTASADAVTVTITRRGAE